jgi:hypothetical protein
MCAGRGEVDFVRFVWAVAAFVLATLMIGAGIAQRTVFQGPTTSTTEITVEGDAPYLLIDGSVMNSLPGAQTLRAHGEGEVFAAYGRTADLKAWLSDTSYTAVTLNGDGEPTSRAVEPAPPAPDTDDVAPEPDEVPAEEVDTTDEGETQVPARNPAGSDLWLDEFAQEDVLIASLQLPSEMSVLVAMDGTMPAPSDVSVSWPIGNGTPWAGPLIVAGSVVMAVGVFLYILAIRHMRRSRGPRRKGLPLPVTEPIDLAVEGEAKGVISAGAPSRRALGSRRRLLVLPAVAVSALLFTGCSADAWPQFGASPTPSPTASVIIPEGQQAPAVTKAQAERILTQIAAAVAEADETMDESLAATRLEGSALGVRSTNYTLRSEIADHAVPAAIPTRPLEILLPQAFDGWPRTVLAIVDDEETKTSSILMMKQADPWSPYKISHMANLEASTEMPPLNPWYVGAAQIPPDSAFLLLPPDQVAAAYADILNKGEQSEFYGLFDVESDQFRVSIANDRAKRLEEFNETGAETGTMSFAASAGVEESLSLATLESGAIVAVNVYESELVKPKNADAVIKVDTNPTVKTLSGATQSSTGFQTTYSDQLFFYVPGQGSSEQIRLLGYSSDILDAKVIK